MIMFSLSAIVLALAWFLAINAAASWCARGAARIILSSRYTTSATLMLALRLAPAAVSILFAAVLFLPAHWRFEPADPRESFGVVLYALAAGGAIVLLRSIVRAAGIARAGRALRTRARLLGADSRVAAAGVHEVEGLAGVSLAGVLRTRVIVGPAVVRHLSREELEVAVAHEVAHRSALDNVKRFAMVCAPDLFGASDAAMQLELRWREAAESLADARAVNGDSGRALHLASALIKVARLSAESPVTPASAAWSTLHDPPLLDVRVRRLVSAAAPAAPPPFKARALAMSFIIIIGLLASTAALGGAVHQATELVVRLLP